MNKEIFRLSVLWTLLVGCISCTVGCREEITPIPVTPASDLPFVLACTFNEQEIDDLTSVVEVPAGAPIRVFGTLQAKPKEALARSGKATALFTEFEPTPLPNAESKPTLPWNRKPIQLPPPDKPEPLHACILAVVVPFGTQPKSLDAPEIGMTNQYVNPDRKTLTFSGGLLSPSRPGKYTLRLLAAFKREREFRNNDNRNQCGEMKTIREITLISTNAAE